jgi:rfaE bifunctional protein nucleotidyltransferase chain/domain
MLNPFELLANPLQSWTDLLKIRHQLKDAGRKIVLTNGCFDLLHVGHIYSLEKASEFGDELWVALNSDSSVRTLKGQSRPIFSEHERAFFLSSLKVVSQVFIFQNNTIAREILELKPDVYVKSGDYTLETLHSEERKSLETVGSQIQFVPHIQGISTTKLIGKIQQSITTSD